MDDRRTGEGIRTLAFHLSSIASAARSAFARWSICLAGAWRLQRSCCAATMSAWARSRSVSATAPTARSASHLPGKSARRRQHMLPDTQSAAITTLPVMTTLARCCIDQIGTAGLKVAASRCRPTAIPETRSFSGKPGCRWEDGESRLCVDSGRLRGREAMSASCTGPLRSGPSGIGQKLHRYSSGYDRVAG